MSSQLNKKETLGEKRERFSLLFARLIIQANAMGYRTRIGEVVRTQTQANANAASGKGIKNSLHLKGLAGDLHLFKDGVYLTKTEDHKPLGEWWESQGGTWGGRFGDGNHYSLEHEGVK